ncbi:MAG: 4Fe-4S binding protein, partial [Rhodocyclaceae bacterium]|nr:4Fe-4S binding protein [Rhodocyclaceae bacterium]
AAVAVGWLYGRGKRVWCRYLCPVSGVFALLARIAPVHFRIDRTAWDTHPARTAAVDCAPLLDVKHMTSASACHACGRCSGHRGAVEFAVRSPNAEILAAGPGNAAPHTSEALLLVFGMLGVAIGAFQWTVSPWFVAARQAAAEWLVGHDLLWPLESGAPWWLLTHYPEANDVFTWLDGGLILAYIGAVALTVGGAVLAGLTFAARIGRIDWRALALSLIPLAGVGLFLGLSMMTATHLRAEGAPLGWLPLARGLLLAVGVAWSGWLGARLLFGHAPNPPRAMLALPFLVAPLAVVATAWILVFYVW